MDSEKYGRPAQLKVTVIKCSGRNWGDEEVRKLAFNLRVAIEQHPGHLQFLVVRDHFTPEEIEKALGGSGFSMVMDWKPLPFKIWPQ